MATCREIFTFSWPLRGRGGGGQPKRSAWLLFHSFFFLNPSLKKWLNISFPECFADRLSSPNMKPDSVKTRDGNPCKAIPSVTWNHGSNKESVISWCHHPIPRIRGGKQYKLGGPPKSFGRVHLEMFCPKGHILFCENLVPFRPNYFFDSPFVNFIYGYQNLSGEKYKINGKRFSSIRHTSEE